MLVFGNRSGKPLRESKLHNVLRPAAERAGLGRVTWHQFRHIHSTLLNDLKVPVKIAQEQFGHASISTTLNMTDIARLAGSACAPVSSPSRGCKAA